ncbi:MAG: serine/threonine-protein kinase [Elusimicrobiota bacterium]
MSDDPLVGKTLGPCAIEALVGRGGMGRVYRGRHLALDRVVAVKVVDHSTAALREAVLAEARAAAKLEDPRIVAVYEVGEDQGLPYIVMQWVDGEGLDALVRRAGPLTPKAALAVMRETVTALRAAHAAGLVHCDVKPPNIMVDSRGGVKLADFGIARKAGSARSADEAVTGSFHFMSPEQGLGAPPDPRSDLYAVGSTWYFALTGEMLFPGSAMDALLRHRDELPPDVRLLRPEVTEKSSSLIRRLLDKDPARRPPDAEAVLREMAAVGMLLETDSSGSPFRILPAPPPPGPVGMDAMVPPPAGEAPAVLPAPAPSSGPAFGARPPAPLPPPPQAASALGSRTHFYLVFAVLGMAAVGWPWRTAVAEDWVAGTAFLASFPLFLTFGDRRAGWRKAAGVALWAASLACLARRVGTAGPLPPLETMIVTALGALSSGGAVYMGLWGTDLDDVKWARGLAPAGGVLLAVAALTWAVPEGRGWIEVLTSEGARVGKAWWSAGGAWRWGGLAAVAAAGAAARRMKSVAERPADGRNLNWNR